MSASDNPVVRVGVIGAGLMGREVASAFGRWFALLDCPVRPELVAVCDVNPAALDWFRQVPSVRHFCATHHELLACEDVDVVYAAVPHHLHEQIYLDVLRAGKDLLAEKPFGIDLRAARAIREEGERLGRFVRVSSEFPFLPGAQRVMKFVQGNDLGALLSIRSRFLHSSDLDPKKPINWKRITQFCGEAGVMNDLGLHVAHVPLRLGWRPLWVYAQLQKIYESRPDGKGGTAKCDTWDNAMVHGTAQIAGQSVPLSLEMKRMAPTETNTWEIEVLGTDRGVRYSTKEPKTLWQYSRAEEQSWSKVDLGFAMPFKTITGGIFEPGFPDLLQQMWAAFLAERAGKLEGRFGCATPAEAVAHHEIWTAALLSHVEQRVVSV
ncbi:Gfo/Idh/MocA family oxidoreductase [Horticoccus luteus]|uniref:Gfo/Idh/MocA family oxidoreductase n=1 Tax=Horticoccus luteus TaxID=2862869 RepID=A0A8F9XLW7_9BACT|nr:Gfo/Idh/MocA family oxidoreductase [Horticoccus luteus]QYM79646.1 Gfo/Idh/MocA family oxidoreductase [Horticoccus luteus]